MKGEDVIAGFWKRVPFGFRSSILSGEFWSTSRCAVFMFEGYVSTNQLYVLYFSLDLFLSLNSCRAR
jgi:hypothetical protein